MAAPPKVVADSIAGVSYAATVTPSDVTTFLPTRALYVGTGGTLVVTMAGDGAEQTYTNLAAGRHQLHVTQVKAATDADDIVAEW